MTTNIHLKRQETLRDLLKKSDLNGVGLNPGPDLSYLTGLDFHLMERPVFGIFPSTGDPVFILPEELERLYQDLTKEIFHFNMLMLKRAFVCIGRGDV